MLIVVGLLLIPLGAVVFLLLCYELLCLVSAIRTRPDQGTTRADSATSAGRWL